MVAHKKPKIKLGRILPRANAPPTTIWTVQAQKSNWYKQKTISGRTALPGLGATITFFNPKFARSPMKGPAVREYAREYPQNIHWNVVTAATSRD
jgi:hypothetical protein